MREAAQRLTDNPTGLGGRAPVAGSATPDSTKTLNTHTRLAKRQGQNRACGESTRVADSSSKKDGSCETAVSFVIVQGDAFVFLNLSKISIS